MALYLVWPEPGYEIEAELLYALGHFELRPGLVPIDSEPTRSKLQHKVNWALPKGTALLAAPLAADQRFKAMEDCALRWVGARSG